MHKPLKAAKPLKHDCFFNTIIITGETKANDKIKLFLLVNNVFFTLIVYCSGVVNAGETNAVAFTSCHLYFHIISIL